MNKCKKFLSAVLVVVIIISCFATIPINALTYPAMAEICSSSGSASIYSFAGTYGHEIAEHKYQSQKLDTLANGTQIQVLGIEKDGDGDPWYKIKYGENFSKNGYAYAGRVLVKYQHNFDNDFEKNLKNFPESYHNELRELHSKYPNWKFVANNLDLTFQQAIEAQYGVSDLQKTRKWVELTYGGDEWRDIRGYNNLTNRWVTLESYWTYASREAIEYFMDPRNSLNEDMIFAFMQQSYQEDAKMKDNISAVIKGTFLQNGYDKNGDGTVEKDAYIEDIITAAKQSGISPYVLAATIIVEQGAKGESALISGKYSGYEGFYNFFNFSAAGTDTQEIIKNGLIYAKQNGWNSRTAAIVGGAKKYADGYISIGQDTYYYKDFNVIKQDWNHQYASALYDAWTNAAYLKKGCTTNNNAELTFLIPVFKDMPNIVSVNPSYMIDVKQQNDCVSITTKKTGVYTISGNNYKINVYDKNFNPVSFNENKQGWPLVANQEYTVKLENYIGSYFDAVFNVQKTFDTIFPDTSSGGWYIDAVTYVVGAGIMKGKTDTKFAPEENLQRQDFVVMLSRLAGIDEAEYDYASDLTDVKGGYYRAAVNWAKEMGITTGYTSGPSAGKFGVGDNITREQIVTFIYRYAKLIEADTTVSADAEQKAQAYKDFNKVSVNMRDAIVWALDKGVIYGRENIDKTEKAIAPQGNASRAEIAQIMYNIFLNNIF